VEQRIPVGYFTNCVITMNIAGDECDLAFMLQELKCLILCEFTIKTYDILIWVYTL